MGRNSYPWYRKSHRCWYAWVDGRQTRLHPDKAEAFRLWHALQAGEQTSSLTVQQGLTQYLEQCRATMRALTFRMKRQILEALIQDWGERPLTGVTAGEVRGWIDSHGSWGPSYRWLAGLIIKAAFRWLKAPLEPLGLPGPRSRGQEAVIPPADLGKLLQAAPHEIRQALRFLALTGCRPGEMCAITAEHVRLAESVVVLHTHKTARKAGRPRIIVLTREARDLLREQTARWPSGPLFRGFQGVPLTPGKLGDWIYPACKRLGLPRYTAYSLRHTYATSLLARGVPDAVVAQLLGHSGTTMLHKHYAHLTAHLDVLREAAERIQGTPGEINCPRGPSDPPGGSRGTPERD